MPSKSTDANKSILYPSLYISFVVPGKLPVPVNKSGCVHGFYIVTGKLSIEVEDNLLNFMIINLNRRSCILNHY